jgi:hypothetical protein
MPKRDPFKEKVFFSVGRDSDGCLSVYTPEQKRGKKPSVGFSSEFVTRLLTACVLESWPKSILKGIRKAMEKIEQQIKEEEEREKGGNS